MDNEDGHGANSDKCHIFSVSIVPQTYMIRFVCGAYCLTYYLYYRCEKKAVWNLRYPKIRRGNHPVRDSYHRDMSLYFLSQTQTYPPSPRAARLRVRPVFRRQPRHTSQELQYEICPVQ